MYNHGHTVCDTPMGISYTHIHIYTYIYIYVYVYVYICTHIYICM